MSQPVPLSAQNWYDLFQIFFYIGLVAGTITVAFMVHFIYTNRKRAQPVLEHVLGRSRARDAVIFGGISVVLLLSVSIASYRLSTQINTPPPASESILIRVYAFQWNYKFVYANNVTTIGNCTVPAGSKIIFNVTALDVQHSFGLPAFKLNIAAIPGQYSTLWITTPSLDGAKELVYQIHCYQYCGVGHPDMIANLTVVSPTAFNQWLAQSATKTTGG